MAIVDVLSLLIRVSGEAGKMPLKIICRQFESSNQWLSSEFQRDLIHYFIDAGAESEWCERQLRRLESEVDPSLDAGSRAYTYQRQAEGWFKLGEADQANQSLLASRRATHGIGYHKDYELNSWIPILERKWKAKPESSRSDLLRLARSIVALSENISSSSMSEASHQLLASSLRVQPSSSETLWHYLDENDTLFYPDALIAIIEAALEIPDVSPHLIAAFLTELILPVATVGSPSLIFRVLLARGASEEESAALRRRVTTSAPIRAREAWSRGIERYNLAILGLRKTDGNSTTPESRNENSYSDYEQRWQEAALSILRSQNPLRVVSDLVQDEAVQSEENLGASSSLLWAEVVGWIIPCLEGNQFLELFDILEENSHAAEILLKLAPSFTSAGLRDFVVSRSITMVKRHRDEKFSNRETSFALQALFVADSTVAKSQFFDTYSTGQNLEPEDWNPFLPYILDSSNDREFNTMVDEFVTTLLRDADEEAPPIEIASSDGAKTAEQALVGILWMHVEHTTGVLRHGAQRAFGKLLREGCHIAIQTTEAAIQHSPVDRAIATLILRDIAKDGPNRVKLRSE